MLLLLIFNCSDDSTVDIDFNRESKGIWLHRKDLRVTSVIVATADGQVHPVKDSFVSTRAIRQPILKDSNIRNAYDGITYRKSQLCFAPLLRPI